MDRYQVEMLIEHGRQLEAMSARNRHERIATAALQGLLADGWTEVGPEKTASEAIRLANALIAALDKEKK